MSMTSGKKLAIGAALLAAAVGYMAYLGAASSWQYYVTTDECLADPATFVGQRLRVSGKVAAGTLQLGVAPRQIAFALEGSKRTLPVVCPGPAPDNLAEQMEVVVEGRLDSKGVLQGEKLITRCASKYESGEGGKAE